MSEAKHTPGPWKAEHESIDPAWWIVTDVFGGIIANVNDAHASNARLIAAAPDLLEAAKGVLPLIDVDVEGERADQSIGWHDNGQPIPVTFGQVRAFIAAIAKAEGRNV